MKISFGVIELALLGSIHSNFVHEHIKKIEFDGNKSCWVHLEGKIMHGYYKKRDGVIWVTEKM